MSAAGATAAKASVGRAPKTAAYEPIEFELTRVNGLTRESLDAHVKLYQAYVEQANEVFDAVRAGVSKADARAAARARESLSRRWSFEASGVRLHEWYFEQLDGNPGQRSPAASSVAMEAMDTAFGGFDAWLADVKSLSETRGVGWVVTLYCPVANLLANVWVDLHHLSVPAGQRVVFALDLWEHAYWKEFGAKGRKDYVQAVIDNTYWRVVESRVSRASGSARV